MTIELTEAELESLLIALGMALGVALDQRDEVLFSNFLSLMNAIGGNRPGYVRYNTTVPWVKPA